MSPDSLIRKLVSRALQGCERLNSEEKAELYEAASLVLCGEEADAASQTAHCIRQAARMQTTFFNLLGQ